jgi:hypothetical protein
VVDASLDQNGKAGAGVAYYTDSGHLQLVCFSPIEATTPFQAEAEAMRLAIPNWSSPYFQKPQKIFTDCLNLVDFLRPDGEKGVPCWKGARSAFDCLSRLRSERDRGLVFNICYASRRATTFVHELATVAR